MKYIIASLALAAGLTPVAQAATSFTKAWTFNHTTAANGQTSEIVSYDSATNSLWVAGLVGIDVLNASTGALIDHIDTSVWGSTNSVAVHNGLAAVAIENSLDRSQPGVIKLFDTTTRQLSADTNSITVGSLPDMVTFSKDGSRLLVANEGTPNLIGSNPGAYASHDPAGSVSIINMDTRTVAATAGFTGVSVTGSNVRGQSLIGVDFEPEYIAVNSAGTKAFVTLQEANAVGVLDLQTNSFTKVIGLGVKDFAQPGNYIDPSDRDSLSQLRSVNVKGLYQPDGIAVYGANGQTYMVMANEGDTREDEADKARVSAVTALKNSSPAELQRLNISVPDSSAGNLVTFGARSFSIRDENGNIVFDSGSQLDDEAIKRGIYDDARSDDKGVEPEGVSLIEIGGRTYAFIGLERTTKGAVAVYDVTDPAHATFIDMLVTDGDLAPEGLTAFFANGQAYVAIANETSGTTTAYAISTAVPEPETYALVLAGLGVVAAARRRQQRQA
ncbi:MAG: choice-of-anchor I family protein [Proteobacteria bacterium]|uniref:choice-of-anchor I family protein n=1 Tax=Aquabacterium sp. TaxID=1872578 RepID=UPI0035C6B2D1|nr:choice-of-anchor I family protein [Pseudomonadota bacterium]